MCRRGRRRRRSRGDVRDQRAQANDRNTRYVAPPDTRPARQDAARSPGTMRAGVLHAVAADRPPRPFRLRALAASRDSSPGALQLHRGLLSQARRRPTGGEPDLWRPPRKRSTGSTISSSPGRRPRCRSASGRSTSTVCTRTSASSSHSSSRRCSSATFRRAAACSIPFAGSGTTLVQALESGYDATGVDIAGFNALLARVKTRPYNLEALRRDLLWAHAEAEAFEPTRPLSARGLRVRSRLVRAGSRRGAAPLPVASSTRSAPPTCCASSSRGRRGRPAARPTSTSSSRASPSSSRTGATSTGASASRSRRPAASSSATRSTRWSGSRRSRPCGPTAASRGCCTATRA